jgi:hypothetical protein
MGMQRRFIMNLCTRGFLKAAATLVLALFALAPAASLAQAANDTDQWIHIRVTSRDAKGEVVRVNVPIEMAEKVLPAINKDRLHDGKVRIESGEVKDVDLRAILDAVRTAKDGEYVTVQSNENNVRVSKSNGFLYINVTDKDHITKTAKEDTAKVEKLSAPVETKVEIKVPMKVVDALLSAGKDELDVLAALRALSAHGDTELVTVKDAENEVRVWIDSKNATE